MPPSPSQLHSATLYYADSTHIKNRNEKFAQTMHSICLSMDWAKSAKESERSEPPKHFEDAKHEFLICIR